MEGRGCACGSVRAHEATISHHCFDFVSSVQTTSVVYVGPPQLKALRALKNQRRHAYRRAFDLSIHYTIHRRPSSSLRPYPYRHTPTPFGFFSVLALRGSAALGGFISTSSPRRLRYDCKSKAGLVYLEPSFEGDGDTIVQPISSLIQVRVVRVCLRVLFCA